MNFVLGLVMAAIFVYIGMNLEPGLQTTVATITTPTYSSGVVDMHGLIIPVLRLGSVLVLLLWFKSMINAV